MRHKLIIIWSYLVELILAMIIYILIRIFNKSNELADFLFSNNTMLLSFVAILFSASIGLFLYYHQQQITEFGQFIYVKGAYKIYSRAFAFPILIHSISFVLVLISNFSRNIILANMAIILVLYGLINLFTTINNIYGIVRLQNRFRIEKDNFENK